VEVSQSEYEVPESPVVPETAAIWRGSKAVQAAPYRARICNRLSGPELIPRNRFRQPMSPGGPVRELNIFAVPARQAT
jgi:hypothetical protein